MLSCLAAMPSHRLLRVRELIKRHVGEGIRSELPVDQAGLITVNDVDLSPDLRHATLYVSILGTPEQQQAGLALLRQHRGRLQSRIAHEVVLKYTPHLRFVVDESVTRGNRVLKIIDELENPSANTE